MLQLHWKSLTLGVALGLAVIGTANLYAQDHSDDQHDQSAAQDHRTDDQHDQNSDQDHRAQPERGPERSDSDTVARYRKGHPGAAARCHDGFFTKTTDRSRACSKHGGIDVWLL